jgi:hypothetical protein
MSFKSFLSAIGTALFALAVIFLQVTAPAFAAPIGINTSTPSGSLSLPASQEQDLPGFTNTSSVAVKLEIRTQGTWSLTDKDPKYGAVDGNGVDVRGDARFPQVKIGSVVAQIKDSQGNLKSLISGKEQTFELQPNETVTFIVNDDLKYYGNNVGNAKINYSVVPACNKEEKPPTPDPITSCLPDGTLTVFANEEVNLPKLTNTLGKSVTLKLQASGQWNFGTDPNPANIVDANGSTRDRDQNGFLFPMLFSGIKPSTLVALKNNQVVASGKSQTISLQPGETVSFIMNDQPGIYSDNTGSQILKYSFECK